MILRAPESIVPCCYIVPAASDTNFLLSLLALYCLHAR
jgi:hypothetical protein